jgi:hypothetical protein
LGGGVGGGGGEGGRGGGGGHAITARLVLFQMKIPCQQQGQRESGCWPLESPLVAGYHGGTSYLSTVYTMTCSMCHCGLSPQVPHSWRH